MRQPNFWPILGIALSPLLLAVVGMFHPSELSRANAQGWTTLHLFLMLLFPMLGVNLWWLVTGIKGVSAWAIRVTGFLFIVYFGGLNVISGIATGLMVQKNLAPNSPQVEALTNAGETFNVIGGWAFLLGALVVLFLYWQLVGRRAFAGGFLLILSAILMLQFPLYHTLGWVTLVVMAVGFGLLQHSKVFFRESHRA